MSSNYFIGCEVSTQNYKNISEKKENTYFEFYFILYKVTVRMNKLDFDLKDWQVKLSAIFIN